MATLTLDIMHDEDEDIQCILAWLAGQHVEAKIIDPHGPGGGWPLVEFTGDRHDLEGVARRYYAPQGAVDVDLDSLAECIQSIKD
jgi:hypothetical protein